MLSAKVRALYSMPATAARCVPGGPAAPDEPRHEHGPTCEVVWRSAGPYGVERPSGPEYDVVAADAYEVTGTVLRTWCHDGLDQVADLCVEVRADRPRGLIRALKDLYDPKVAVVLEGARLEQRFSCDRFGRRALVVEMTGGVDGPPDDDESRRLVAGLLFKDDDIGYDLSRTDAELPADLNAPIGSEVFVWDGQTLVWRMHPVARARHGDAFAEITATVVACGQAADELLERVRSLDDARVTTTDDRLRSVMTAQASLERDVQARLDLLAARVGRPAAAHLDALVRKTGLADRIRSVADLLARSRRTIELELSLHERRLSAQAAASAADVRTVVVVFAVVSVVLGVVTLVVDLGGLPDPAAARIPQLPTAIALAVLVSLGAAVVAFAVLLAARTAFRMPAARAVRVATAGAAVTGSAGLVWVALVPQVPVLVVSLGLVLSAAVLVAWQLRLAADTGDDVSAAP